MQSTFKCHTYYFPRPSGSLYPGIPESKKSNKTTQDGELHTIISAKEPQLPGARTLLTRIFEATKHVSGEADVARVASSERTPSY